MPNHNNVQRPIIFIGLGRSGTSAITEMLGEYPDIESVGEIAPVVWDLHEDVRAAYLNMRYPTSQTGSLTREGFPAQCVRDFFVSNFHSERKVWVAKPIGLLGKAWERFTTRSSDESFTAWYFKTLLECFPGAQVYSLIRDPIEYARSARRYWRAPIAEIVRDVQFMGAILRSGEIAPENLIPFAAFTKSQDVFLEKIARRAGIEDATYRGSHKEKRFASKQGNAVANSAEQTSGDDLSISDLNKVWDVIGDEYAPFVTSERASDEEQETPVVTDERNYREAYLSLCGEFEFLSAKAEGLETLVNTKEDIIQKLLKWTKYQSEKTKALESGIIEAGVKLPPLPEWKP